MSTQEVARVFGVGQAPVTRYMRQRRETGTLVPKPHPGRQHVIGPDQHAALCAVIQSRPAASLAAYCRLWQETDGTLVSLSTMSRTLSRLGFTRTSTHRRTGR
jgi:transposase